MVRCSQCSAVFNGKEYVSFLRLENLPAQTQSLRSPPVEISDASHRETQTGARGEKDEQPYGTDDEATSSETGKIASKTTADKTVPSTQTAPQHQRIPSLLQDQFKPVAKLRSQAIGNARVLGLGTVMLVCLLAGQYLYFHRHQLAHHPTAGLVVNQACRLIGCEVKPRRDVELIELLNLNVFSHPSESNALVITATFANRAAVAQPYPVLQVALTDLQGRVVAARRFLPRDYLAQSEEARTQLAPDEPISVNLEVVDPGVNALAYEFDFL